MESTRVNSPSRRVDSAARCHSNGSRGPLLQYRQPHEGAAVFLTVLHCTQEGNSSSAIIGGSCHKSHFCSDKYVFVATNMCFSRQNTSFVATKVSLQRQNYVCRDKTFVATNICRDKHVFVTTNVLSRQKTCLSRQNYACSFVATKLCL